MLMGEACVYENLFVVGNVQRMWCKQGDGKGCCLHRMAAGDGRQIRLCAVRVFERP